MKKTVLTLSLLAGVCATNMNAIYAGDPDEVKSQESSVVGVLQKVEGRQSSTTDASKVSRVGSNVATKEIVGKSTETEKGYILKNFHNIAFAVSGVATVGCIIAAPSYATAAIIPWMGYGALKIFSAVKAKYDGRLTVVKSPANLGNFDFVTKYSEADHQLVRDAMGRAGIAKGYGSLVFCGLLGKSENYLEKFAKLSSRLRMGIDLSEYQHALIAKLISRLTEEKIAVFEDILGFFEEETHPDSWYNILEDIAESLLNNRSEGECLGNKVADALIRAQAR